MAAHHTLGEALNTYSSPAIYRVRRVGWLILSEHNMKAITLALLMCLTARAEEFVYCSYSSYVGRNYETCISKDQLENTPKWVDGAPDPPLSARSAKEIATVQLHEQVKEADAWRVDEIALTLIMNDDRWVYIVSFSPPRSESANESLASPFKIVVLMDGTVVKATLFKPNQ